MSVLVPSQKTVTRRRVPTQCRSTGCIAVVTHSGRLAPHGPALDCVNDSPCETSSSVVGHGAGPRNFHRKITSTPGFLTKTGRAIAEARSTPVLYRAGPTTALSPPLIRDTDPRSGHKVSVNPRDDLRESGGPQTLHGCLRQHADGGLQELDRSHRPVSGSHRMDRWWRPGWWRCGWRIRGTAALGAEPGFADDRKQRPYQRARCRVSVGKCARPGVATLELVCPFKVVVISPTVIRPFRLMRRRFAAPGVESP